MDGPPVRSGKTMFRFAHPEILYALAGLPVLALFFLLFHRLRGRRARRFGRPETLARLTDAAGPGKGAVRRALILGSMALLIVAAANPQVGTRVEKVELEGVDIFILLDVSESMKARDVAPDRLERARLEIRNLIGRLAGDRVGLIVFAGEAYVQFPLTTDYAAAELFADVVDTDAVPVPGTAIGAAIDKAVASFDEEEGTTRVVVLITDGENTSGDAERAAAEAAERGVRLYAIGMGTNAGAPIPVIDESGETAGYKRDRGGEIVMSRLDPLFLEEIAAKGGGGYYPATPGQDELREIYDEINALEKREFGEVRFTDFESRYRPFVAAGFLLALLELFVSENRGRWWRRWLAD